MKAGIITDTHDLQDILQKAIEVFTEHQVKYILHAGDITSPSTAHALASIDNVRFIAVFGNCDFEKSSTEGVVRGQQGEIHRGTYKGNIENKKVLMAHNPRHLGDMPVTDDYDLIVYGHTHIQNIHRQGNTLIINPGQSWAVILDLDSMDYETIYLG
ncbi:MAG: YfcE family phosphodiesterase [Sedimentisphaerales bacterium]|nr:YfcE family phosphodiesterase [Sedimentisphaerales bacterium]